MSSDAEPKLDADVLVLGASFAGIEVLYQLQKRTSSPPPRVIVIDRERRHGYLPLVQERLLGTISLASSVLESAAWIESVEGARFVQAEVVRLDPDTREVELDDGRKLRAKIVVVALGSVLAAPQSLPGAERLVVHKSGAEFEHARAAITDALASEGETPRIVVVGGGISGVELAGELAALRGRSPIPFARAPEVTLVGADPRLVPILPARVGEKAKAILVEQGVDVRVGTKLVAVHEDGVTAREGDEEIEIPCALAVWVGGIRPAPVLAQLGLPRTDDGWLEVGPTLQCFPTERARAGIFACGDAVRIVGGTGRWPTMQRAIECIWQAKIVAKNVLALLRNEGEELPPLLPHRLRETFAYGVSLGARSLVVWGNLCVDVRGVNHWFRRWLMRQYFARYEAPPAPAIAPSGTQGGVG
ncbi:MAG TPA: FAD-dependent oxidoreductase [Nannocystaceae bacterium]|nr:FAD-dependent oxidoreductase [Nannocystaceae bacterium]